MSIIIYGPQGCGKTLHADKLRRHFNLTRVDENGMDGIDDPYRQIERGEGRFAAGRTLYLTNVAPPDDLRGHPLVKSFAEVMNAIDRAGAR